MARYYRRGHWVNSPGKGASKGSGWVIAAGIALVLYALAQNSGDQSAEQPKPSSPASVSSTATP
ncbi:hypothetical protein Acsp03_67170 [Actinomadura sp. NBRC 104412]|uniref:hypothetical protein n=1 Tax=Actinomadura sp. NBRC 104412 TaxID=3032203 RepID=UPI0024A26946|nr:hypothetical protein [Actinomadura sp. NBRC 104412]GLZ09251.1 hypothetical protein Acsp03_67170 [Actinomadura sp. NBRC 104412]